MKKAIALILAAVMALGLCACGSNGTAGGAENQTPATQAPATSSAPQQQTAVSNTDKADAVINSEHEYTSVIVSLSSDAKTLCPYAADGGGREYTRAQAFESLTFTSSSGEWEMVIAKEITNPEPTVYDVEIYDYVFDQAGNHVTASDIVFSYDKFIEDGNQATMVKYLKSYEATGEYTVRFTFDSELKGVAQQLFDKCVIVTEKAWNDSPDTMITDPVGTGPYKLTSFEAGSYYIYEYTDNYWQKDESLISTRSMHNVDKVTFRVMTDRSTDAIALQKGETDASGGLNAADYINFMDPVTLEAKDGYNVDVITNNALYNLVFNCSDNSPCADINLRKAICYAIDTASAAYLGFGAGQSQLAIGYTNPVWLDYTDKIDDGDYFPYDEAKAKEYLAQSSYNNETIRMLVCYNNAAQIMATAIQAYCAAIGINMELLEYDSSTYSEEKREETGTHYDIIFNNERSGYYAWGGTGYFASSYHSNGTNQTFIYDEKLDELYNQISLVNSTDEDYVEFCHYIEDQCYGYALSTYYQPAFTNGRFHNIVRFPQGNFIIGACTVDPD